MICPDCRPEHLWLQVVATFKAHEQNVRGMSYDADKNQLLTCSFDRTVCIFQL